MNGVLHSEHVISRSGIAVSPRERKRGPSLPCSSERWRCVSFNHERGAKALFFINARRKAGVPTVILAEFTPAIQSIQFFCAKLWQKIFTSSGRCGTDATPGSIKPQFFARYVCC